MPYYGRPYARGAQPSWHRVAQDNSDMFETTRPDETGCPTELRAGADAWGPFSPVTRTRRGRGEQWSQGLTSGMTALRLQYWQLLRLPSTPAPSGLTGWSWMRPRTAQNFGPLRAAWRMGTPNSVGRQWRIQNGGDVFCVFPAPRQSG